MDILETVEDLQDGEFDELELPEDDSDDESDELDLIDDDELALEMSEGKAREVTDAIRAAASATYVLLSQAHEGRAHKALGYATWADYVNTEFDISAARSYQLLDLSKVIKNIEEATPDGTRIKLTEAQARDIKRELPKITKQIEEETEGSSPDEARDAVDRIIEEAREQKRADEKAVADREKSVNEALDEGRRQGLEDAATAMLDADSAGSMGSNADDGFVEVQVAGDGTGSLSPQNMMDIYNFFNVLEGISSLPEPDEFVAIIPEGRAEEINNQLNGATSWLNRVSTLWELRDES